MRFLKAMGQVMALLVTLFVLVFLVMVATMSVAEAQAPAPATRVTDCSPTTPNNALCLTWTAPATNVDGSPTVQPMTYRIEQRLGASGPWATVQSALTVTRAYVTNLAPGVYFFRVFVNCATCTSESEASNVASQTATAPPRVPRAPVVTIAVLIGPDASPTTVTVNGEEVYASSPAP